MTPLRRRMTDHSRREQLSSRNIAPNNPTGLTREDLSRNSTIGSRTRTIAARRMRDPACLDQGCPPGRLSFLAIVLIIVLVLELVLDFSNANEVCILLTRTTLSARSQLPVASCQLPVASCQCQAHCLKR
jgi:hypothetical protein